MKRRVVITGCGIISSIGNNRQEVLASLQNNVSGIEHMPEWAQLGLRSQVAGTIKAIDVEEARQKIGEVSRYMDLSSVYATLSAEEAISDAKIPREALSTERTACIVGSGTSNTEPIARTGLGIHEKKITATPYDITRSMSSSCSANLANIYGVKGRSYSMSSACATSLHNIGHGCELIWNGSHDVVLAGGAEEVSAIIAIMFDRMRTAISKAFNSTPTKASRPYDKKRDGFVVSGGCGIVVLEEFTHASRRGAEIYGEITGYGATSDGHDIIQPHPEGDGAYRCMKEALNMANCLPEKIDCINAHATSTLAGDIAEAKAIQRLLGGKPVPICATKSHTGHGIGAAGAQELIYCLLMMKHGFIPASINIDALDDPFKNLNIVRENKNASLKTLLKNSFGFGGTNACLVINRI